MLIDHSYSLVALLSVSNAPRGAKKDVSGKEDAVYNLSSPEVVICCIIPQVYSC